MQPLLKCVSVCEVVHQLARGDFSIFYLLCAIKQSQVSRYQNLRSRDRGGPAPIPLRGLEVSAMFCRCTLQADPRSSSAPSLPISKAEKTVKTRSRVEVMWHRCVLRTASYVIQDCLYKQWREQVQQSTRPQEPTARQWIVSLFESLALVAAYDPCLALTDSKSQTLDDWILLDWTGLASRQGGGRCLPKRVSIPA